MNHYSPKYNLTMNTYHKIQTIFKREQQKPCRIIEGEYSLLEFEYLKDTEWVFTEKIDGTNIRIMWDGKTVTFGGKTDNAQMPVPLLYKLQELFEGAEKRKLFKETFGEEGEVCLYGEGYGAKIQNGGNYIPDGVSFVLFDVKIGKMFLKREDVEDIAVVLGIKVAPIIGIGTLSEAVELTRAGFNSQWGDFAAEGLVLRPRVELRTRRGDRIIAKIKCKDFINKPK